MTELLGREHRQLRRPYRQFVFVLMGLVTVASYLVYPLVWFMAEVIELPMLLDAVIVGVLLFPVSCTVGILVPWLRKNDWFFLLPAANFLFVALNLLIPGFVATF